MMTKINNTLIAGASVPFYILHASDTHLTECDERDNERKNILAKKRTAVFPRAMENYHELLCLSEDTGYPLFHTGDLIDFVSEKNLDLAKDFADSCDLLFSAGNHEFSQYVGEAFEDAAYRNQSLAKIQHCFHNNIRFDSRIIYGVNFVVIDNSYYLFEPEQIAALKKETAKGYPVILLMHNPLYEKTFFDRMMLNNECAYVTGAPDEYTEKYSEYRRRQQKMDEPTKEMMAYIAGCPFIKAILCGHTHFDYEGVYAGRIPQFITGTDSCRILQIR